VVADEAVRVERAGRRGHAALAERTGRQLTQEQKAQRADFTVRNDGSRDEFKATLSLVLGKLDKT
jgi:dephospho-CoA kinase